MAEALAASGDAPAARPSLLVARYALLARALMAVSGFAGLGYQVVWVRQGALWLGQDSAAVLAVVAAFFGGLALGAFTLGARIERSTRPARWYAGCELVIAVWAAALLLGQAWASELMMTVAGAEPGALRLWVVAFVGSFVLLLPATAAMGATLPALAGLQASWAGRGSAIAGLYAANTAGAMAGVLATAFWLLPAFGLWRTAAICVGLNLLCAAASLGLATPRSAAGPMLSRPPAGRGLRWRLAVTGWLGIGYEVMVLRVLGQVFENTVYTLAMVLAVYLAGTALGAWAYQRVVRRHGLDQRRREALLLALAAACLSSLLVLLAATDLQSGLRQLLQRLIEDPMAVALASETVLALLAFGLPTVAMGALFSQLCDEACARGLGFSRALGWNTLGAALAPPMVVVLALPALGAKAVLLGLAAGYLALLAGPSWRGPRPWGVLAAGGVIAVLLPALVVVAVPPGGHVERLVEGPGGTVSVVDDGQGVLSLHIDNRQQEGSNATRWADGRQSLLPLLLHGAPERALFLGVGTGVTATTAAAYPALAVDAVELLPEVLAQVPRFVPQVADLPRLRLVAADARRHVRRSRKHYDVIVADNVHPARSGSGSLYTVEHFRAVQQRLGPAGLFCQWLPLHQMDLATLRSIVRSFQAVFPEARAVLATHSLVTPVLGLVAGGPARTTPAAVQAALDRAAAGLQPADYGLGDPWAVLGSYVAGPGALARWADGAAANTDDHPVVAYRAPRATYAPEAEPADRLLEFLTVSTIAPHEVIYADGEPTDAGRLAAYWRARDDYLAVGRDVRASEDVRTMLAQVREPLLGVLSTSADFTPAYAPLRQMAAALAESDRAAAQALLDEIERRRAAGRAPPSSR